MRIGAVGSYGFSNYQISSVYGNPGSLRPIKKIGQDTVSGNTVAVLKKTEPVDNVESDYSAVREKQRVNIPDDYQDIMAQMQSQTKLSAATIPTVDMAEILSAAM